MGRSRSPNRKGSERSSRRASPSRDRKSRRDRDRGSNRSRSPSGRRNRSRSPHNRSRSPRKYRSRSPARRDYRDKERERDKDRERDRSYRDKSPERMGTTVDDSDEDEQNLDDDGKEMLKLMGFAKFKSTKGKHVPGSCNASAANIKIEKKYRQYMNRRGGFNRPLDPMK
ncbi:PREDICTED: U4/U6.U5 small nuclear ribonucleoprotein 27 kDa protein-like [Amphimedon queenslandica]|uniref:U4/U6.U5 small nuclear ribonucleoprotein 27 kDa protein n=1 Tax=Amphimedon queenslandica TaxID=400682 RepID=A0A1X7VL63_AMPQE|nr:PREDICTED: U4/U6.U5 small nuclear ribonucleoprotein 27 kDa protein-like [Amphimedon queenslandica]|eukprot:XP_003383761.1 PREDICTED: U4/U6.U5 small nuclear ribonucleoprotein 27 kDa protein-like [Amphimedon queenslandica]